MSDASDGRPQGVEELGARAVGANIDLETALALARAAVHALIKLSPDAAALVRAELRKEAVGLEMKGGPQGQAAAAALRRVLDGAGQ